MAKMVIINTKKIDVSAKKSLNFKKNGEELK